MQIKVPIERTNSLESSTTAASTIVAPDPDSPSLSLSVDPDAKQVLVSVTPPDKPVGIKSAKNSGKRPPLDICCVIDISGSMGTEAPIPADPTTGAPAESTGLSVLDVVKHAIRTIIATMQEDDRIALVTFSDSAQVQAGLTEMTEKGRSEVLEALNILLPQDCTNLWDGLKMGMDLLTGKLDSKAGAQKSSLFGFKSGKKTKTAQTTESSLGRFSTLFILTDGMPNIIPPRGHTPMLKAYLDALDNSHTFSISTFGFGYSLDSPLLLDIAQVGGGGYSFIPDSGIVGTVFVNAVANAYATFAPRVRLDVEIPEGTTVEVKGSFPVTKTTWGVQVAAGDLQFGQTMDLVLVLSDIPKDIIATLNYRPPFATEDCKVQATLFGSAAPNLACIKYHAARLEFVEILWSVKKSDLPSSVKSLETLAKSITTSPVLANDSDALALEKDMSGEGLLALETANYNRWGRHYLPSLARSHQRQQCGNFKDPGLQVYGRDSKVFIEERDKLDAAFMALPPPKPSVRSRSTFSGGAGGTKGAAPARPLKNMKAYYSSSGPCFAGSCLVAIPGGRYTRVDQLRRGMEVQTLCGTGKVAAVLRTHINSGETLLCRVGDLLVTPWHPIVSKDSNNTWVFPADVASPELLPCDAVYSLLLLRAPEEATGAGDPNAHSVSIAGVWCVTLGHGLTTGNTDVRSHGFLGDYRRVLKEFSKLKGFFDNDGLVQCVGTRRNSSDGTICGFVGEEEGKESGGRFDLGARCKLCA